MQESFSTLWTGYATDAEAKAARDARYRQLKAEGKKCRRWVLRGQIKQYESFGVPDGRICDVYKINIYE